MTPKVIDRVEGNVGRLSLNRPKAIHALDLDMVLKMTASLIEWLHRDDIEAVLIDHHEGRGFCAGGDVVSIAQSAKGTGKAVRDLDPGMMLYPTGNKEGVMWEVEDELGNKGWVSSSLVQLAR